MNRLTDFRLRFELASLYVALREQGRYACVETNQPEGVRRWGVVGRRDLCLARCALNRKPRWRRFDRVGEEYANGASANP